MRPVLFATLALLALVVVPFENAPVGTAAAEVVCRADDVECHKRKLECYLSVVLEGEPRFCAA